jgi:hypothetical protein
MIIQYFTHDIGGAVTGTGNCHEEFLHLQGLNGDVAVAGIADPYKHYIVAGTLVEYTPAEMEAKNSLPPGWTWQMPERVAVDGRSLDQARARKWDEIKRARTQAQCAGFTWDGMTFDSNEASQLRIYTAALGSSAGAAVKWTLANNQSVLLSAQQMAAVGVALSEHLSRHHDTASALRAQIQAAPNPGAIDLITWPAAA